MKIAIVCDWLTNMGGAERVVLALHNAFPDAPIYTSVFDPHACPEFAGLDVRTTYLQKLPQKLRSRHQLFPLQRTKAFRSLDLQDYEVIISSSSAEAKAVIRGPRAVHICYCHTPTRYYWSHYKEYIATPGFGPLNPAMRLALPALVRLMRRSDLKAAGGVDEFIANSTAVAARIKKYYGRESTVIHPPVDMNRFRNLSITGPRHGFIVLGRQVPYKRKEIAIQACNALRLPLTLYGIGPEHRALKKMAGPTISFVTDADDVRVARALASAKAFLFPQEEDFGIVHIEAMAAGCPVIAYAKGGALDSIIEGKTGVFMHEQTSESLIAAIKAFSTISFDPHTIQAHAEQFSEERFVRHMRAFVTTQYKKKGLRAV